MKCALAVALLLAAIWVPARAAGAESALNTPAQERKVGEQQLEQVRAQMGLVTNPGLVDYVSKVAARILAVAPSHPYTFEFHVVDEVAPNAFAVPGGFVFVTRGLLALCNSEAELANVLGHEIAHVLHRDAAHQQAIAHQTHGVGLRKVARLRAYGRNDERAADSAGQRMAAAAGYDPHAMTTFLANLDQAQRLDLWIGAGAPSFLETHPSTPERETNTALLAGELGSHARAGVAPTHEAFLRKLVGLPVGADGTSRPSEGGVTRGNRFVHAELGFSILFPKGWAIENRPDAVRALSPDHHALILVTSTAGARGDPGRAADDFGKRAASHGHFKENSRHSIQIAHAPGVRIEAEAEIQRALVRQLVTFFPWNGAMLQIEGMAPALKFKHYRALFMSTPLSFRPVGAGDAAAAELQITVLDLATARSDESFYALAKRTGSVWNGAWIAVMNGREPGDSLEAGEIVKIAKRTGAAR